MRRFVLYASLLLLPASVQAASSSFETPGFSIAPEAGWRFTSPQAGMLTGHSAPGPAQVKLQSFYGALPGNATPEMVEQMKQNQQGVYSLTHYLAQNEIEASRFGEIRREELGEGVTMEAVDREQPKRSALGTEIGTECVFHRQIHAPRAEVNLAYTAPGRCEAGEKSLAAFLKRFSWKQ